MKRAISIICILIFANFAVAHPFDSGGGGSSSSSEETDLTLLITITVVVGLGALLVTDILADDSSDSQDELSGIIEEQGEQEVTGVDWEQLNQTDEIAAPLLAISIFPSSDGKDLASYFSNLIEQGNSVYFNTYNSPVSFGDMTPYNAASTGFAYLDCQLYLAVDSLNLLLFTNQNTEFIWSFEVSEWDSTSINGAAENFLEFASTI